MQTSVRYPPPSGPLVPLLAGLLMGLLVRLVLELVLFLGSVYREKTGEQVDHTTVIGTKTKTKAKAKTTLS